MKDQPVVSEVVGELLELVEERLPRSELWPVALASAAAEAALRAEKSREWLLDRVAFAYDEGERPLEESS
jgi:hypothetical protein